MPLNPIALITVPGIFTTVHITISPLGSLIGSSDCTEAPANIYNRSPCLAWQRQTPLPSGMQQYNINSNNLHLSTNTMKDCNKKKCNLTLAMSPATVPCLLISIFVTCSVGNFLRYELLSRVRGSC